MSLFDGKFCEEDEDSEEDMSTREDVLLDLYKIHAYIPNDEQGNPLTPFGNFCAGYEACQANNDTVIAELVKALEDASVEFKKLPRSLGYDITHCKRYDALIAKHKGQP